MGTTDLTKENIVKELMKLGRKPLELACKQVYNMAIRTYSDLDQ